MDTSPEYIKMCRMATEIQASNKDNEGGGDWLACPVCGEIASEDDGCFFVMCHAVDEFIFLPRQDQLQEMIRGAFELLRNGLGEYAMNVWDGTEEMMTSGYFPSAEQATLAGLMTFYGKTWNGEEWK